jgi:hypothetical protein
LVLAGIPDPPLTLHQTEPGVFTAYYEDQMADMKARVIRGDEGEEHIVRVLPHWEDQIIRIREAFDRDMIPDNSQPPEDGVIFVKSADGSPPDPEFERIVAYTLGDDPMEHQVKVHRGETWADVRENLKKLHPGKNPTTAWYEGGTLDGTDAPTD